MRADDREKIGSILERSGNFTAGEIAVAMELVDIYISDASQNDYEFFVDEEEEIVRGYVCIGPRPLTEGTYDLYWIAVDPEIQSKGIGSSLMRHSEDHIIGKGGRLVLIETSSKPSYEKERRFYEKNHYSKLVVIRDFYRPGDSLVIYGKYL
ncbi:MAG: GNAT family N-acetyltransferase [Ignavibacteria bacterium]|nr:GNAT family N-acetyltransferase [Ignavibacteria bacterium]